MFEQMNFFKKDVKRLLGKYKIRVLHIWLSRVFWGLFLYRFERGLYLSIGKSYRYVRIIFIPWYNLLQSYSNIEIHYKANIQGGLLVLHPSVGVVVSAKSVIGINLTLTGGNIIGGRSGTIEGDIIIGDNCSLGANAVIIGPVYVADNTQVGASACVVSNIKQPGLIVVGVPAKPLLKNY